MQTLKFLSLAICLGAVFDALAADAKVRKFAMASGQSIEAELIEVKPGHVTLLIEGKKWGELADPANPRPKVAGAGHERSIGSPESVAVPIPFNPRRQPDGTESRLQSGLPSNRPNAYQ